MHSSIADGLKEVFFRNVFSAIQDRSGISLTLQAILTMNTYDNFNVLVEGRAGWWVTHAVWSVGSAVARLVGLKPWYEEYTPDRLREVAESGGFVGGGREKSL